MSGAPEALKDSVEHVDASVLETVITNLEKSKTNAQTLQQVLREEDSSQRYVRIESISGALDLGGFFMDEVHSNVSYRHHLWASPRGGDALSGRIDGLVMRKVDDNPTLQIQLIVGASDEPIDCFFDFNKTLEGCHIVREDIA